MKNVSKILCFALCAIAVLATSCHHGGNYLKDETQTAILKQYVENTIQPTYTHLANYTDQLVTELKTFKASPTQGNLNQVCATFLTARSWWEKSSMSRWVMTQDGIYVYNSNLFVPWSQMITTGLSTRHNKTYLTVQIKKERGEFLKQAFQLLMVKPEDGERISETIRAFIHAIDKMKMLKRRKDEKEEAIKKKKTWY